MRRLVDAVRDHAMLPGPALIWTSDWVSMPLAVIAADDICAWPYSVGILVNWVGTLHWPAPGADLAVGGVSYVELLLLCDLWAGERLVSIVGQVAQYIWRSCRLIGALMRALCTLPGGIGRFVPSQRETVGMAFLDELLVLFRYAPRPAPAILLVLCLCVGFLLRGCHLMVRLLDWSLMVVLRSVLIELSLVMKELLFAFMMVLVVVGLVGLVIANESD